MLEKSDINSLVVLIVHFLIESRSKYNDQLVPGWSDWASSSPVTDTYVRRSGTRIPSQQPLPGLNVLQPLFRHGQKNRHILRIPIA